MAAVLLLLTGCGGKSDHDKAVDAVRATFGAGQKDVLGHPYVLHSVRCHQFPLVPERWDCTARIDDVNGTGRIVSKPCHVSFDGDKPPPFASCGPG